MRTRRRWAIVALGAGVVISGCSGGGGGRASACQADGGAQACLVPRQGGHAYELRATGFQPDSELRMELTGPSVGPPAGEPKPIRVDGKGKYPPSNVASGLVVPSGSGPVTVTISGTAGSGRAVVLAVSVGG